MSSGDSSADERDKILSPHFWYQDQHVSALMEQGLNSLGEAGKMEVDEVTNPETRVRTESGTVKIIETPLDARVIEKTKIPKTPDGKPIFVLPNTIPQSLGSGMKQTMAKFPAYDDQPRVYVTPVNVGKNHWVGVKVTVTSELGGKDKATIQYMDSLTPHIKELAESQDFQGKGVTDIQAMLLEQQTKVDELPVGTVDLEREGELQELADLTALVHFHEVREQVSQALPDADIEITSNLDLDGNPMIVTQNDQSLCGPATTANLMEVVEPGRDIGGMSRENFLALQKKKPLKARMELRKSQADILTPAGEMDPPEVAAEKTFEERETEYEQSREKAVKSLVKKGLSEKQVNKLIAKAKDLVAAGHSDEEVASKMQDFIFKNHDLRMGIKDVSTIMETAHADLKAEVELSMYEVKPKRPYKGVGADVDFVQGEGFKITEVFANSPAEELGLKPSDVISRVTIGDKIYDLTDPDMTNEKAANIMRQAAQDPKAQITVNGEEKAIGKTKMIDPDSRAVANYSERHANKYETPVRPITPAALEHGPPLKKAADESHVPPATRPHTGPARDQPKRKQGSSSSTYIDLTILDPYTIDAAAQTVKAATKLPRIMIQAAKNANVPIESLGSLSPVIGAVGKAIGHGLKQQRI